MNKKKKKKEERRKQELEVAETFRRLKNEEMSCSTPSTPIFWVILVDDKESPISVTSLFITNPGAYYCKKKVV